ncbi:MAG: flagellar hook-associated protein FlgK [Solirubrobacteraceae bacterium]|nr:flagellar hook-associated protein FlgK [Patulibacter sp.]
MTTISSFGGLQTTLRGLLAHQRMLDVTSHNISNADTEGYTRQTAVATAAPTLVAGVTTTGGTNMLGQGVDITAYNRVRDNYLDVSARTQNMLLGDRATTATALSRADTAIGEPSDDGLNEKLNNLWTSFGSLASASQSSGAKVGVISAAKAVTDQLSQLDANLSQIQSDAATEYSQLTAANGDVANYTKQLATLNDQIGNATAAGQQPNDMLDQRDLILNKLSTLGQVSVTNNGNGKITVKFGDAAQPLVDGSTPTSTTNWPQTLTNPGGQLGALINTQAQIGTYRAALDNVASQLASTVNGVYGTTPPFFTGNTASTLTVAATATTLKAGTGTAAESNDIATALSQFQNGTAQTSYQNLVVQVGADSKNATAQQQLSISLVNDVTSRQQSVSGVSLDEEMTNLITFQRGYQASARAMSTMDEMLDQLINRTGKVGL